MGWLIIGILLLIFFSGSGTLFCFVFLNESGSIGAWCATGICVVITCIVVCYLCVKELWNIGYIRNLLSIQVINLCITHFFITILVWRIIDLESSISRIRLNESSNKANITRLLSSCVIFSQSISNCLAISFANS